jgi:hypothetical protein
VFQKKLRPRLLTWPSLLRSYDFKKWNKKMQRKKTDKKNWQWIKEKKWSKPMT